LLFTNYGMRKYNVSFARLLIIDRKYRACQGVL
jgi:hypothetical protein